MIANTADADDDDDDDSGRWCRRQCFNNDDDGEDEDRGDYTHGVGGDDNRDADGGERGRGGDCEDGGGDACVQCLYAYRNYGVGALCEVVWYALRYSCDTEKTILRMLMRFGMRVCV